MITPPCTRKTAATLWLTVGVLILGLTVGGLPAQAQDKISHRSEIRETLASQGRARVIVQFQVPGLAELTNASRAARQDGEARDAKGLNQAAVTADQALGQAVAQAGDAVLGRLPPGSFQVGRRLVTVPFLGLWVDGDALAALEASPRVVRVQPDRANPLVLPEAGDGSKGGANLAPQGGWSQVGDPAAGAETPQPPNLLVSADLIGAANAWSRRYTGAGWYVAVLDTGLRKTHEMFAGKTIYEACFASGQTFGLGDCPNGATTMLGSGAAVPYPSFYTLYDHGNHIAGIAAGHSSSVKGVAYDANLIAIKAYSKFEDATSGYWVAFWDTDMLAALDHVYQLSSTYLIAAANIAGGGGQYSDQATCDADNAAYLALMNNLKSVGIPTFVASGNDAWCSAIHAPACVSSAVAVAASTKSDTRASFANWQSVLVDVFAPGAEITSSVGTNDTSYAAWSGSSMASAHLSGAFALLRQYSPTGNMGILLTTLLSRGTPIISTDCASPIPKPRVQVDKAMVSVSPTHAADRTPMYRAYNPSLHYHFFTTHYAEFLNAVLAGYNDESTPIPFYPLVSQQAGSAGINRLYNPYAGTHYYTAKAKEAEALVALGWTLEKVEGYIFTSATTGASLIYKLYNTTYGAHLYTSSLAERDYILANLPSWQDTDPLGYAYLTPSTARQAADGAAGSDPYLVADAAAGQAALDGDAGVKTGTATGSGGTAPASSGSALASGSASPAASGLDSTEAGSAAGSAVRDFNGDGASDLVWLDGEGKVNLWYLNGESVLGAAKLAPSAPAGWQLSQVGDFNGDGHPDLLWYDPAGGAAALWLLAGETVSSENALGRVADPAWAPVLAADFNGDGTDDLLWRNPATGGVAVWYLANGKLVKSATLPATLGPGWQVR
ncbi:MAG: S8 family serine peptidase [Deltaproteobacteria bacterium]|nr:S8 family serine peptidase [Deltaproteobacteria bacterium]